MNSANRQKYAIRSTYLHWGSVAVTAIAAIVLVLLSGEKHALLPAEASPFPYVTFPSDDSGVGGASRITLINTDTAIDYSFHLEDGFEYPYTSVTLGFDEQFVNWQDYQSLMIEVACNPANVLMLTLHTVDPEVTTPDDFLSYRRARTDFSCTPETQQITIDLAQLATPKWWLLQFGLPLTHRDYDLSKVFELAIENSQQSPRYIDSRVSISKAELRGRDWHYLIAAAILASVVILILAHWLIKRQTTRLREELQLKIARDTPVTKYQPLTATCKSDRERQAVLQFMATHYADPDLNLETTTRTLGINRVKVNDILRQAHGLTFSPYLKKLRLTEAARLLREKDASVAEIGFMVGYNNAPYFNQVFKQEFDCTPNVYKKTMSNNKQPQPDKP